jgi:hypothetical protein
MLDVDALVEMIPYREPEAPVVAASIVRTYAEPGRRGVALSLLAIVMLGGACAIAVLIAGTSTRIAREPMPPKFLIAVVLLFLFVLPYRNALSRYTFTIDYKTRKITAMQRFFAIRIAKNEASFDGASAIAVDTSRTVDKQGNSHVSYQIAIVRNDVHIPLTLTIYDAKLIDVARAISVDVNLPLKAPPSGEIPA